MLIPVAQSNEAVAKSTIRLYDPGEVTNTEKVRDKPRPEKYPAWKQRGPNTSTCKGLLGGSGVPEQNVAALVGEAA